MHVAAKPHDYFGKFPRMLGKQKPRHDKRTLQLSKYLKAVPTAPKAFDPDANNKIMGADWGMMVNDSLGDCTCAGMGHIIEWWTALASKKECVVPDSAILRAYEDVGGYIPGRPETDNGSDLLTCLQYWKSTGVFGHKIAGFAQVKGVHAIKQANWLFGAVYSGVMLPVACQDMGDRWDLPKGQSLTGDWEPGSWGGHCVPIISYDEGVVAIVTWGKRVKVTYEFLQAYFDEFYAPLSLDWVAGPAATNGFDYATLAADLQELGKAA